MGRSNTVNMAINETAKAIVDVDGQQAALELKKLEDRSKELRNELAKLGKDNDLAGFRQKEKELKLVQNQMKNLKKETFDVEKVLKRLNGSSFNDLTRAQRQLTSEIKRMSTNTKEEVALYNQKIAKLKQINIELGKVKTEMAGASVAQNKWLGNAADKFNKYFGVISAGVATFTGVVFSIKSLIQSNVELDDSLADVRKTTGLTQKEVRELYTEFNNLNTRTPKKELLQLAEEAGRLGINGKKNIMAFVDVANQIKVALGDDLGGDAAEAIKEVGKLTNVFKVGEKYGVDFRQSMLMVGSSINEVSANSAADAPFLIDMAKRMAGVSSQAGIAVQDIIGMAAALDEMGQTSEVSATTLNKVIVNMFKDTADYADIAGMGLEEFTTLLNQDANEALMRVLGGLNGNNTGLATMAQKLDGLELDGARSVQTLAALASNIDLVKKNQELANASLEKGTSLTNEYQIKNNNMAGSLEKIGRALRATFVSSGINEALGNIITKMAKWVDIPVSATMEDERIKVNALAYELANSNTEQERRKKAYEELRDISPDIVKGLDQENINLQVLTSNLARYNEEAIKKIALQKAGETLDEVKSKMGAVAADRGDREFKLMQAQANVVTELKKVDADRAKIAEEILMSDDDLISKNQKIQKLLLERRKEGLQQVRWEGSIWSYATEVISLKEQEAELQKEVNKELEKYGYISQSIMGKSSSGSQDSSLYNVPNVDSDLTKKKIIDDGGGGGGGNNLDKLADQQAAFRMRIINESKSLIEQENIAYQERLKEAGLFGKKKETLTGEYLEAYDALEKQHVENIKKINDQAFSDDLMENQKNFDQVTAQRQAAHNNEMAALIGNEEAQKALEKKFQDEELKRQESFLVAMLAELQQTVEEGSIGGIDEKLLSEEQKEILKQRIDEIKLKLSELGLQMQEGWFNFGEGEGSSTATSGGDKKVENVDIFGMSSERWAAMIENIMASKLAVEDVIGAVGALTNAWSSFYQIKNNLDQQDLQRYESDINSKKDLLQKQLDRGIISQEEFNERAGRLEEDLDTKRRAVALKAAKRERQMALMNAIVNTASGIVKMLNNPFPLNLILAALVGVMGGLEIAKIATTPLPQYYSGKYDVIGAKDGKKYSADVMDSPGTGLVNSPAILVGEKPEIIIDPPTTRNLQINYPEVIDAINYARVPQYGTGKYPSWTSTGTGRDTITERQLPDRFYETMERLNAQLERGIGATLVADGQYMKTHNEVSKDYQDLQDQVNLRG